MATQGTNLSNQTFNQTDLTKNSRVALVVAEWNAHITGKLMQAARDTLVHFGVNQDDILIYHVPGSFELALCAQWVAEIKKPDAIITIGCVIRGETAHFDYVCQAVTHGVNRVALDTSIPVIFCVLTDNTEQQSLDRAGGKHGNKGVEAAVTALKMIALRKSL